jgi:hypothetical protein
MAKTTHPMNTVLIARFFIFSPFFVFTGSFYPSKMAFFVPGGGTLEEEGQEE